MPRLAAPTLAADVHYFTADRLARHRALGEHVQKTLPPSNVCSRLHNLVARDDINSYLDLVWVTYDDLVLVVALIVLCSHPSHDCHQTM